MSTSEIVYFDYNATTPLGPAARRALIGHLDDYENPSSLYPRARAVKETLEEARDRLAGALGASEAEVIFTASGTEAINMALLGVALRRPRQPRHIITTRIEHAATLTACQQLEGWGVRVDYLPVDGKGCVSPDDVRAAIGSDTTLISVMHANNEVGVVQPVGDIARIARDHGVLLLTDAVQTVGKLRVEFDQAGFDMMALSAHKFQGPKGMGALVRRRNLPIEPLINGGGQESGMRGGTENVCGAVAMAAAANEALHDLEAKQASIGHLRDRLWNSISELGGVRLNSALDLALPGTLNVSFRSIKGDALATALAFDGIAVSTGSACHAKEAKPSHVLTAMGIGEEWLFGAVRFSLGPRNTVEEVDFAADKLRSAVARLRRMCPRPKQSPTVALGSEAGSCNPARSS